MHPLRLYRHTALVTTLAFAGGLLSGLTWASDSEVRPLSGAVHSVHLSRPINLEIHQGDTQGIEIEAPRELRARVSVDVKDGELRIGMLPAAGTPSYNWTSAKEIRARVVLPQIRKLDIKGSGDVTLGPFDLKASDLQLSIEGSGDINATTIKATSLKSSIRGSGDIRVAGQVDRQEIDIAGSGDVDVGNMQTRSTSVSIKGSGDAAVWATEALSIAISGSGDVSYSGRPALSQSIRGSGEVIAGPAR